MSDYYYLKNKDDEDNTAPVLGDDYIAALLSIAKKKGINITNEMILKEIGVGSSKRIKRSTRLYIDGTNLFAGQNELFGPQKYLSFQFLLKEINKLIKIDKIYFYASYMNKLGKLSQSQKQLIAAEALFYREVKHSRNVIFYKGHRSIASGKEKGVDVHLAVDILKDVVLGNCDKVVIMSGDADLIYPIEVAKTFGVSSQALFLPNRFSLEMAYKVERASVLNFLNKFQVDRKLPKKLKIVSIKKPRMVNIRGK